MKHAETEARSFIKTLKTINKKRVQVASLLKVVNAERIIPQCNNVQLSCFLNGWPFHHQCVEIVFSAVHWFPKWMNPNTWRRKKHHWLLHFKEVEVLRKPKHCLPQVVIARGWLMFWRFTHVLTVDVLFGLRLLESTAVWRKRRTCCCPLCRPCRRKLNIWSTTWAQRPASNWTCSRLWETPAGSWRSLKVPTLPLNVCFVSLCSFILNSCVFLVPVVCDLLPPLKGLLCVFSPVSLFEEKWTMNHKQVIRFWWKSGSSSTTMWP